MDSSFISISTFIWAFKKIRPAEVVDKIIDICLDVLVPGRGTGENNWWMRGIRRIQQSSERTQKELEMRSDLGRWDREFPHLHHELIIRYAAGFLASSASILLYDFIRGNTRRRR